MSATGSEPRRVPIHRAFFRPQLWGGGERKPALTLLILALFIGMARPDSVVNWVIALVLYLPGMEALRRLAKKDARFFEVYQRQRKYAPYYPPRRGIDAPKPRPKLPR